MASAAAGGAGAAAAAASGSPFYEFDVRDIKGKTHKVREYAEGKVTLVVNLASKCGFTGQYEGLQKLYDSYKDRGFTIMGFPCNQFGGQEPGTEAEVEEFACTRFKATFPMFSKVLVNGSDEEVHPLYQWLKKEKSGVLGMERIPWNFSKFLVDQEGKVVDRYAPTTGPDSIGKDVEALLAKK